jgi:hypothetical protein
MPDHGVSLQTRTDSVQWRVRDIAWQLITIRSILNLSERAWSATFSARPVTARGRSFSAVP